MNNQIKKKSDRGFTLTELIIVLVIISVIAAIASPNFFGLLSRIKVDNSFEELLGAIRQTQRQAMKKGQRCRIDINLSTNTLSASPAGCLLNKRILDNSVIIRTNLSGATPNISFSHKGNTTKMGTIVLSSDFIDTQKCFVISLGLGIMRTGNYIGSKNGSVSASNCKK